MGTKFGLGAFLTALILAVGGCTVHQSSGVDDIAGPALAGPSDFALSLSLTATPDSLSLDGGSQSAIVVEARNATGGPQAGLSFRFDLFVNGTAQDCGTLSARNVVTGSDGKGLTVYTAPSTPLPFPQCANFNPGNVITVVATPTGNNFDTANSRSATIRLLPTGVIVPPASTPTAAFVFSPASPTANSPVSFNATTSCGGPVSGGACSSTSRIVTYSWDFGDSTSGSGQTTTHSFTTARTYNVTLTVTNDRGIASSTTQAVTVGAGALPTAAFTSSPTAPGVNQDVFFNAVTSRPGLGHSLASYSWNYGDGTTGTGVTSTHAYSRAGSFAVTLVVTDESGQTATASGTVTVGGTSSQIVADFTFSPTDPDISNGTNTVRFDGTPSVGTAPLTYAWDFGDSVPPTTGTGVQVSKTFTLPGSWVVRLTVTDSAGRTATVTKSVVVVP